MTSVGMERTHRSARIAIVSLSLLLGTSLVWGGWLVLHRPGVSQAHGLETLGPEPDISHPARVAISGRPSARPSGTAVGRPGNRPPEASDPVVAARLAGLDVARARAAEQARSPEGLGIVLAELEARAARNGVVSAFEVEPGFAAIDASLAEAPEEVRAARRAAFSEAMTKLSAQLSPQPATPPPGMTVPSTIITTNSEGGPVP